MQGFVHRYALTYGAGGDLIGTAVEVTSDSEQNISVVVPNNTADFALGVDWPANKLQDIIITVSKDCTLEVNSASAPTDTLQLKAGVPFVWLKSAGGPSPFAGTAGAITGMFVTVPTSDPVADCTFNLRTGVDF